MRSSAAILIMTLNDAAAEEIVKSFGSFQVTFLKSKPTYNNYLKTLQYLPQAIVIELPDQWHDQLHFIQMVKQNDAAREIPIICFGDKMMEHVVSGMRKVGVDSYFARPFEWKKLATVIAERIQERGFSLSEKNGDRQGTEEDDDELLLSPATPPWIKTDIMVRRITRPKPFPFIVSRLLNLMDKEEVSQDDLIEVVRTDPVIAEKLIEKAGELSGADKALTVGSAVARLGRDTTRRILSGMAVMLLSDTQPSVQGFNRTGFWVHCLATAVISSRLAEMSGLVDPEEAFSCGLLHDFGIIIFEEFFPGLFSRVLQLSTDYGMRFRDAEKELLAVAHDEVLRKLFAGWKLPHEIADPVADYGLILQKKMQGGMDADVRTVIVALANIIAKTFGIGASCDQCMLPVDNSFLSFINIPSGLPETFYAEVNDAVAIYLRQFDIPEELPGVGHPGGARLTVGIVNSSGSVFIPVEQYLRLSGHELIAIPPSRSYREYDGLCDVAVVFTDCTTRREHIEALTVLRCRQADNDNPGGTADEGGVVPVVVFVNRLSICTEALTVRGISLISDTVDLRMIDEYMSLARTGKLLKILPWELVIKSRERTGEAGNDLQRIYRHIDRLHEKCRESGVVSDVTEDADSCLDRARTLEKERKYTDALLSAELAGNFYRKALCLKELEKIEKSIRKKRRLDGKR